MEEHNVVGAFSGGTLGVRKTARSITLNREYIEEVFEDHGLKDELIMSLMTQLFDERPKNECVKLVRKDEKKKAAATTGNDEKRIKKRKKK